MKLASTRSMSSPANAPFTASLWMIASTILFVTVDTGIKAIGSELHPFEVGFFRNVFGLAVLLPIVAALKFEPLRTDRLRLILVRGVLGAAATLTFFLGVTISPLAEAITVSFMAPLFGVVFAVFILAERVGPLRWFAVILGLLGTAIVVRPGIGGLLDRGSLLLLSAAVFNGLIFIVIKILTRTESSLTITLWMTIAVGIITLVPAVFVWKWPTPYQYIVLFGIGSLASAGQYAVAQSLRLGDASVLMPVDFLKLVWATCFGFLVFSEIPTSRVYCGAILIILANLCSAVGNLPGRRTLMWWRDVLRPR